MATYIVTGGTGFVGQQVLPRLLRRDPRAQIHVLVRDGSLAKLVRLAERWDAADRIFPLFGDLSMPGLGMAGPPPRAAHLLHLGAVCDLTAPAEVARAANVAGTEAVIDLARAAGALLHHVSSIAVAGNHCGRYTEDDFDLGQGHNSLHHETTFTAEKLVRENPDVSWRVYRPAVVVGDSTTGEIDKIDGPHHFLPRIARLARLPRGLRTPVPNLGDTNVVPVDFVADAIVELMHRPGLDGRAFHLVNPRPQPIREIYDALADAAGAPRGLGSIPAPLRSPRRGLARRSRKLLLTDLGIPEEMAARLALPTVFTADKTAAELAESGIAPPPFASYAGNLWTYWREHLDRGRVRRRNGSSSLRGRVVAITGASSGIGRSAALESARRGAIVLLIARSADKLEEVRVEIELAGGRASAYPCDITDDASVARVVDSMLADHAHIDYLVNNAGRSIRRSVAVSTDRMHDFERTMAVNYFGAVRLVLALLPGMRERGFGHIVNVSSIGVQGRGPQFAAYIASKSALDAFADCASTETLADGVTFTTINMPLTRTPMIAPTPSFDRARAASPEAAATLVVRAMEKRPIRISTLLGTASSISWVITPRTTRWLLSQRYQRSADSPAALGEAVAEPLLPSADLPGAGLPVTGGPRRKSAL